VLDELTEGGLLEHAKQMGDVLGAGLEKIAKRLGPEKVVEARGAGLLRALELTEPAGPIVEACRKQGVLVIVAGANVLRLAPPLVIERDQIEAGLEVVERVLAAS